MPTAQKRNTEMVDLLAVDFQKLRDPVHAVTKLDSAIMNTPRPLGFWNFAQYSTTTGLQYDQTFNGNNLTRNNAVLGRETALIYESLVSGSSAFLNSSAAAFQFTGNMSCGGWFRINTSAKTNNLMGVHDNSTTANASWRLVVNSSDQLFFVIISSGSTYNSTTIDLSALGIEQDEWFFAGGMYNTSTRVGCFLGYQNGYTFVENTTTIPASKNAGTVDFRIGYDGATYADIDVAHPWVSLSNLNNGALDPENELFRVYSAGYHNFY